MKDRTSVTIRRIKLDNLSFEGITPMELISIAADLENRMDQLSEERNVLDVYKLALYAALDYAAQVYTRSTTTGTKTKEDTKQLDEAILKLTNCLESLPLK